MNAVEYALKQIRNSIPSGVLQVAFYNNAFVETFGSLVSIDESIRDTIIRDIVMVDLSTVNGILHDIPMHKCKLVSAEPRRGYVYHIPKSETMGREILSISNIAFNPGGGYGSHLTTMSSGGSSSPLTQGANESLRSASEPTSLGHTAFRYLNNNNIFLPMILSMYTANSVIRCFLAYDDTLSGLNRGTYRLFGKLCVQAAKRHIYNEMRLRIDQGYIEGGFEIAEMKNIIDEYSDAHETYDELLNEGWGVAALTGDPAQMRGHIALLMARSTG